MDVGAPGRSIWSLAPEWDRLIPPGLDDFETDITGRWFGNGTWSRTNSSALSGSYSLSDSEGGDYTNDTTRWVVSSYGADITGRKGCRINYSVRGRVLDGDLFASGSIDDWGTDRVERAESVDTHGQWEAWSDGISVVDGNPDVHALFEVWSDTSGTADGVYIDDVRFVCRAADYTADSYWFDGTSMATPHVSGVAALARAAVPAASAAQVAQAIREGAVSLPSLAGKTVTGGRADAPATLAAARRLAAQPSSAPPAPPAPPAGPGSSGASGDHTPLRARLLRARVRGQLLLLTISFPNEADAVTGKVTVARLQRRPARYRTRPGRPVTVKVGLRPAARRALASGARKKAALTIRARDTAGNTAVTRTRVTLRAP